jgi:hypothetical protein
MAEKIKRIDLDDFRRLGFLQELNRRFLHPLGLALEVYVDKDTGKVTGLGGIWDYRDDEEGMFFGDDTIKQEKIDYVENLRKSKVDKRKNNDYGIRVDEEGVQLPKD